MVKLKINALVALLLVASLLAGCTTGGGPAATNREAVAEELAQRDELIGRLTAEKEGLQKEVLELKAELEALAQTSAAPSPGPGSSLLLTALQAVELLRDQDMNGLAAYVDPVKGVRFSPYGYVNLQSDLFFSAQAVASLPASSQVYTWGAFDGTGDPIDYNFNDYYGRFIYDQDFASPHLIGNNTIIGTGNTLINLNQVYPNGSFVEFHFTGFDPQYAGMDWRSLRLVFEQTNGIWYLVGIVHDEWTI